MRARSEFFGFTLVEIMIVLLILAIFAAVALPKVIGNFDSSSDAAARHNLGTIRDAIESYYSEWGKYPRGKARPVEDEIGIYLHGSSFPESGVGNNNNKVRVVDTGPFTVSGTEGWAYNPRKGDFIINSDQPAATEATQRYSEW